MAAVPVPGYQAFWADKRASLQAEYNTLIEKYPDADTQYRQLYSALCATEDVAGYTPAVVGESAEWTAVVSSAEDNRANYCKDLTGKTLFSALYGTYTVTLKELKSLLKASTTAAGLLRSQLKMQASKKFGGANGTTPPKPPPTSKKAVPTGAFAPATTPPMEITTRNFFSPLRAAKIDTESAGSGAPSSEATAPGKTGRPPPIILTSAVNLIQLQKQLKGVVSEDFEFRSTRNGARVITRGMADFQSVKSYFENHNLSYFSFFSKNENPIKAVICHFPHDTPAVDISEGLVSLGFDVVSVKQMTTTRRSPTEEPKVINLPSSS
jgi:hypothetical protein